VGKHQQYILPEICLLSRAKNAYEAV